MNRHTLALALTAALLAASRAVAQAPAPLAAPAAAAVPVLQARPAAGDVQLDGRLDEAAWASAPVTTGVFVQRRPNPGVPSPLKTEVRVLFGGDAVYVGARMYDRPDSIAAQLARRDATGIFADWFILMLDSDNDRRTAFYFAISPRGVRKDGITTEQARTDLSFDAVWDARTSMDSAGWTAEMVIPLSQLRYDPSQTRWSVNFGRETARREEMAYWAPMLPNEPGFVSRFGTLEGMTGLGRAARLELSPYTATHVDRAPGESADPFYSRNELGVTAGLDARYRITDNLTLTATINPDFGQVEADPSVVNLTAFETFQPERRPFFVQGADIFDFRVGTEYDTEMLFYSRRIGRVPVGRLPAGAEYTDQPDQTTILGAAKLSGKTSGGWSIGLLDVLAAPEYGRFASSDGRVQRQRVEPLTHFGVARVIKDFRNGRSALGTIFTSTNRSIEPSDSLQTVRANAYVAGVDGRHRFLRDRYELTGWLVGSSVDGKQRAIAATQRNSSRYFQRPDAGHLDYDPERTSLAGYASSLQLAKIGGNWTGFVRGSMRSPGFEVNDLGYQRQTDRILETAQVRYAQYRPQGMFRSWSVTADQALEWTHGQERVQNSGSLQSAFQLRNFWGGFLMAQRYAPVLAVATLRGGPALYSSGYTGLVGQMYTDMRKPVSGTLFASAYVNDEEDGSYVGMNPSLNVRPSPRFNLSVGPSFTWAVEPAQYVGQAAVAGETRYFLGRIDQTTVSLTTRLNYTFSPNLSFQFYASPFISAGSYDRFRTVADPHASDVGDRYQDLAPGQAELDPKSGFYRFDVDGNGTFDASLFNPAFNVKQLRSNAVMRWEYRPGSTLFVVWNQGRSDYRPDGSFDTARDFGRLWEAEGRHVLMVKLSYWFSL